MSISMKDSRRRPELRFCVIGEALKQNEDFTKAIEQFELPVSYSSSGLEPTLQGADFATIYVLDTFDGELFTNLHKADQRILGPTTIMQCVKNEVKKYVMEHISQPFPNKIRPWYTTSMKGLSVCFSGFRTREEVGSLAELVHCMSGSVRNNFSITKTTHLVVAVTSTKGGLKGDKYKYAANMGIPIMSSEWVLQTWARRHDINCSATDEIGMRYKLLPFVGCRLAFVGYTSEEQQHMAEITVKNGGEVADSNDPECTHIIVEDGHSLDTSLLEYEVALLKNEWFWVCIQMEAKAIEEMYIFENANNTLTSSSFVMPIRGNKRQRLESVAHQLALESHDELFSDFRRKADVKLSISGSFLDATFSPDKSQDIMSPDRTDLRKVRSPPIDMRTLTPRQQVCFELYQTESNYVGILHTIMTVFKEPLERLDQVGGALLAPAEIKIIFGNLPPIYEIHQKIRTQLTEVIHSWSEDHSIGNIILNHAHEFMKSYPPFVNFFEKTKEVLTSCDSTKPRFHAFLKCCQSKPECGRQTLQELLIRPVQRLPSVILLLNDILKNTPKSNPDNQALEKAIEALKNVLLHINEDKRKTEGQVEMFEVVNDIENCPPHLLSSHRTLVFKTELQEITDYICKKNSLLTVFLFNDMLEVCKKRSRAVNHLKSPSVASLTNGTLRPLNKSYKHIELLQLGHIRKIVNITDSEESKNNLAVSYWSNHHMKETMSVFILADSNSKNEFMNALCKQLSNVLCKPENELIVAMEAQSLDLHSTEPSSGNVLTKALNKTRNKLGGALSMKKTPTKRSLSRAVSTIISPLRNFSTPHNLSSMRLSSVTNLTQLPNMLPDAFIPLSIRCFKSTQTKMAQNSNFRSLRPLVPRLVLPPLEEKSERAYPSEYLS